MVVLQTGKKKLRSQLLILCHQLRLLQLCNAKSQTSFGIFKLVKNLMRLLLLMLLRMISKYFTVIEDILKEGQHSKSLLLTQK